MNHLDHSFSVTVDQANRIAALGGKYHTFGEAYNRPPYWDPKRQRGWYGPEENADAIRAILAEEAPRKAARRPVLVARSYGYDPGVRYYEVDYQDFDGARKTAKLSTLENEARGVLNRGMNIDQSAADLYADALTLCREVERDRVSVSSGIAQKHVG